MPRVNESPQRYRTSMDWLNSRQQLGIELGLERIEALMDALGRPHQSLRCVHVAGTNGKGSVATLLSEALRRSGHRTGLFTSPHLVEFGERIRVDGEQITRKETVDVLESMRHAIDDLDRAGIPPTFFEICTAAAFVHFRDRNVAWAVVETGMGGRNDSTNIVDPQLSIITNVTMDHMSFLGDDITAIAKEKAGIIKRKVPLVTGAKGEALDIIDKEATRLGSPLLDVGADFIVDVSGGELVVSRPDGDTKAYQVGASGAHQAENAALVVAACDVLGSNGVDLSPEGLAGALAETVLAGRLEHFHHDGIKVIIDSAHNVAGAMAVALELSAHRGTFDLVVGFNEDKDWRAMLHHLVPLAKRVWAIPVRSPRSLQPDSIGGAIPAGVEFTTASDFGDALVRAQKDRADRILVTGSIFLAGEARARLTARDLSEVGGRQ